jgi:hypothetical protein
VAALAVVWLVLLSLFALAGAGAIHALRISPPARPGDRLLAFAWLGLLACANTLLLVSVVLPLAPLAGVAALAIVPGAAALSPAVRAEARGLLALADRRSIAALAALLLGVAALACRQVTWYDTGLYHYGMIRWLARHGTVPGLALLHSRFGITSSWFALPAALEGLLPGRTAGVLGGFVVLLAALRFVLAAGRVASRRAGVADYFALCSILLLSPYLLWMGASAAPDLPVLMLTVLVSELLLSGGAPEGRESRGTLAFAIACGAFTVKASSLPLALASGLALLPAWRSRAAWIRVALISAAALLPVSAAGVLSSGCPLYPASVGCVTAPWSLPPARAAVDRTIIHEWARWEGSTPAGAGDWNWVIPWLARNPLNAAAAALLAASCFATGWLLLPGRRRPLPAGAPAVLALALGGSLFVLWQAPAPRFLWGYVGLPLALACAARLHSRGPGSALPARAPIRVAVLVAVSVAAAGVALSRLSSTIHGEWPVSQLLLPSRMGAPSTRSARVNDVDYRTPVGDDRCWAAPLPCTPYTPAGVKLRAHARGIDAGFVRLPEAERSRVGSAAR